MPDEKKDEGLPSFQLPEKRVDTSWKEEMRKEREMAAAKAAQKTPGKAGQPVEDEDDLGSDAPPAGAGLGSAASASAGTGKAGVKPSKLFVNFLAGLVQQTLMQLGRLESPYTGQRELDLEGARYSIELLAVLQEKTKGNLHEQEARVLNESLRDLKIQYVEIANEVSRQMQEQLKKGPKGAGKK